MLKLISNNYIMLGTYSHIGTPAVKHIITPII